MANNAVNKKVVSLLMALLMILSFTGCGVKNSSVFTDESANTAEPSFRSIPTAALLSSTHYNEGEESRLSETKLNCINMLNYMSALMYNVDEQRKDQLFLESAYNSFDNLYPNAVDKETKALILDVMDTIEDYRMITIKRTRLEYIHEQNRAQAMRQAIPNPLGLLSAVQSGSVIKAAVSVLYMAADATNNYKTAISQADQQFINDGWELDDAEAAALHKNAKTRLAYLLDQVRTYDLPGDLALSKESIESFVDWSRKPDEELAAKIEWFVARQKDYEVFGPYWLELAKDYYKSEDYKNCLYAINRYDAVTTRIFRKNVDYANVLPMAIFSARETMSESAYIEAAEKYCSAILENIRDSDWSLKYFVAQIYVDLYTKTSSIGYLEKAYAIAKDNIVILANSQRELNAVYQEAVKKEEIKNSDSKRVKKEKKAYNKLIDKERETALPPVNEALYLNCDLLFALAGKINISMEEQKKIDAILHKKGENIFLPDIIDARFSFSGNPESVNKKTIDISFNGKELKIPAVCLSDHYQIIVTINGANGTTTIDDWTVKEVERPKKAGVSEFVATLTSKAGKAYKYQAGDTVTIRVIPVKVTPDEYIEFAYSITAAKKALVFNGISFERVS